MPGTQFAEHVYVSGAAAKAPRVPVGEAATVRKWSNSMGEVRRDRPELDSDVIVTPVCRKLRSFFGGVANAPIPDPLLVLAGKLDDKFAAEDAERDRRNRKGAPCV